MYEIRIELLSDLCAAGGEGYATTIDTDVVTDKYGIPYIPARRLKGCLRDAAVYIYGEGNDIIDNIFGIKGDISSGSLKVENANIEEYASFNKMCRDSKQPAKKVTELFTETIASTAVDSNGRAKENSLRFMRVVSKNKAWDSTKNLVFCSDVEIGAEYVDALSRICKALRHIGYKRNRGFGNVRCTLAEKKTVGFAVASLDNVQDDKEYVITYAVRLDECMMLPSKAADETMDFISGQAVVGSFVEKYLKTNKADEVFDDIFLSGNVRFSNLYITDKEFRSFVPVPQIFGKTKQSNEIFDLSVKDREGIIVKPLKSGYINADMKVRKPLTERVYHNSINDSDSGLYIQNCLQNDQLFMGTISGNGTYIKKLAQLLADSKLSFGRSRTAQYSRCSLVGMDISKSIISKINFKKGEKIVYLFESDVLIADIYAGSGTAISDVCVPLKINEADLEPESGLKYRNISGFLSVMRMQRAHLRAIAAGSALVVRSSDDITLDEIIYVGGRQNEGFGKIRVFKAGELMKNDVKKFTPVTENTSVSHDDIMKMFDTLDKDEKMRNAAIAYALEKKSIFLNKDKWGAAFTGRVTLMLKQSDSESNFRARIESIKTVSKKKAANDFLKNAFNKWESDPEYKTWEKKKEYLYIILTLAKYFLKEIKGGAAK